MEQENKIIRDEKGRFVSGYTPWNKDLKAETDERVRKNAEQRIQTQKGRHYSKDTEFKKGSIPWIKGKKMSEEYCQNDSKVHKGKHFSPKTEFTKESRAKLILPIKDTLIELKIQGFLTALHLEYFTHKYISEITHAYQCDILIPKQEIEGIIIPQKTIIECDGCYWHGCKICNKSLNEFQQKQIEEDNMRTKELIEKGYKIIRLWEHNIKKMELNNFQSKIFN